MKKLFVSLFFCGSISYAATAQIIRTSSKAIASLTAGNTASYKSDNGRVTVKLVAQQQAKNDIKTISTPLNSAMCLTKEEIRGQKVENEQIIADGSRGEAIMPGAVINTEDLLTSGRITYIKMDKRKPITLTTPSNLVKKSIATVNPVAGQNALGRLVDGRNSLTTSNNMINPNTVPNVGGASDVRISTIEEKTGIDIGASAFYMGISAEDNFKFSSEKYQYMYMFEFEQRCITVMANNISSPADVFTDNTEMTNNWLYIPEVSYGRRVYVLIESEYDLEKYSNAFEGGFNWGVVGAAYRQTNSGSSLRSSTNMRIVTQGGQLIPLTNPAKVQEALDKYFQIPYKQLEIVPIAYKLTYLDGKPVSVLSEAFLNANKCLDKTKVRINLSEIVCTVGNDGGNNEQVYGAVKILLYNKDGKQVMADGKTVMPVQGLELPTQSIVYAKENAPLVLYVDRPKKYDETEQGAYTDINISNLDMVLEVKPWLKEKDDFGDDTFGTQSRLKKSIRQMLIDGTSATTFEFRHDNSVIKLTVKVSPVY
jgi:hypothetical protein